MRNSWYRGVDLNHSSQQPTAPIKLARIVTTVNIRSSVAPRTRQTKVDTAQLHCMHSRPPATLYTQRDQFSHGDFVDYSRRGTPGRAHGPINNISKILLVPCLFPTSASTNLPATCSSSCSVPKPGHPSTHRTVPDKVESQGAWGVLLLSRRGWRGALLHQ